MAFFESEFWHPSVATDIVLFTIRNKKLSLLLVKRKDNQMWELPGGFLTKGESLNECAMRELKEETGIEIPFLRQFENFSNPKRDHRGQTISVAFIGIHPSGKLKLKADTDISDVNWYYYDKIPQLAFDHNEICMKARKKLNILLNENAELIFPFLEEEFTLTEMHETLICITTKLNSLKEKRNFRKWIFEYSSGKGLVKETGNIRKGNHRPAKLYIRNI